MEENITADPSQTGYPPQASYLVQPGLDPKPGILPFILYFTKG